MLKLLHSLSVTIIQSFHLPHARIPSLLPVSAGFFWECSDLLLLYKWTCVIHRLSKLNKKTETSPQSLVAEVLEPKKNLMEEERLQKAAFGKLSIKREYSLLLLKLAEINYYSFLRLFQIKAQKENTESEVANYNAFNALGFFPHLKWIKAWASMLRCCLGMHRMPSV